MTVQEIVEAALSRGSEFGMVYPSNLEACRRRIQAHLELLFATMADINPDYIGRDYALGLTDGRCDIGDLVPLALRVRKVFVEDAGGSAYRSGSLVSIVPIDDLVSALAPRMTLRDSILQGIGHDLDNVASVRIWYAKRPTVLAGIDSVPESPEQYHELHVIDLAKQLTRKAISAPQDLRKQVYEVLGAEYDEAFTDFTTHLRTYNFAETARHGRTALRSQR